MPSRAEFGSLREWRLAAVVGGAALLAGVCAGLLLAALRKPVTAEAMVCPACPSCPPTPALASAAGPGAPRKLKHLPPRPEPLPGQDELSPEDQAKLRAWIEEQASELRACGADHGRALLALDVTTEGRVRKAQLLAHDALPRGVSDCILQRALTWRAPVSAENRLLVNLTL